MGSGDTGTTGTDFVDFFVNLTDPRTRRRAVTISRRREYLVHARSEIGDVRATTRVPFTGQELENTLLRLENDKMRSATTVRVLRSEAEATVEAFGAQLLQTAMPEAVYDLYQQTCLVARREGKGVRLRLRVDPPELAAIPWEFLYDARERAFVGLSATTPIVRDIGLTQPLTPLAVTPPLRVLGVVASPPGLDPLDIEREQRRVEQALAGLVGRGLVALRWMPGQSWRDLTREIRQGGFHVLHFIGHGGFDPRRDEGLIALTDDAGAAFHLPATDLGTLLATEDALRLVVLNSCDGARGGTLDVFSSTAAILVHRGVPAVVAMQYEITDEAAIEFSRTLYEAIADGAPLDAAVGHARMAVRLAGAGSIEWATPVLYQRAPDGVLFTFDGQPTGRLSGPPATANPKTVTVPLPTRDQAIDGVKNVVERLRSRPATNAESANPAGERPRMETASREPQPAPVSGGDSTVSNTTSGGAVVPRPPKSAGFNIMDWLMVRPGEDVDSTTKRGVVMALNLVYWSVLGLMIFALLLALSLPPGDFDAGSFWITMMVLAGILIGIRKAAERIR